MPIPMKCEEPPAAGCELVVVHRSRLVEIVSQIEIALENGPPDWEAVAYDLQELIDYSYPYAFAQRDRLKLSTHKESVRITLDGQTVLMYDGVSFEDAQTFAAHVRIGRIVAHGGADRVEIWYDGGFSECSADRVLKLAPRSPRPAPG